MGKTVDFIFDLASPNAYLAHKVVKEIEARTGASFKYIPALLGGLFRSTNNQPPMVAFGGVKGKLEYEQLEMRRFIEKHKLTQFRMNSHFPVNTLLIMRGLVAAEMAGEKDKYIDVAVNAMWEEGLKMDDPDVVLAALNAGGLDGAALLARTQDADVKQKLIDNTEAAAARGAFGVPTFYVGDEMFWGKERLGQVEELLA